MQVISVDELLKYQGENVIVDSFEAVPMSVIEDIKDEIKEMRSKKNCSCSDCLDIIDKHISGDMRGDTE